MAKGLFVTGTGTGVGKTAVSAALLALLRRNGKNAGYYKPVQSGAPIVNGLIAPPDALFVSRTAGLDDPESTLYAFPDPVSPHLASRIAGQSISLNAIAARHDILAGRYEYLVTEGAGGLAVPLSDNGNLMADLARLLSWPLLIVAHAGLGTINHTLLTVAFARSHGLPIAGVILNGGQGLPLESDNARTIEKLGQVRVWGILPALPGLDTEKEPVPGWHNAWDGVLCETAMEWFTGGLS